MDGGKQLLGHPPALHQVRLHNKGLLIQVLRVNTGGNALFIHAVGQLHNIANAGVGHRLKIDFDIVKLINNGKIPGGKLEVVYRQTIAVLGVALQKPHSQGMNDNILPHLNHQVAVGKELGGLFHQQGGGKGHKVQRALEHLIGILKQQAVNGIGSGKIAAPLLRGIGLVLSIVLNLVADDPALQILDRLSNDIFAVCHHRPPLLFNFSQQVVHNIHQVADLRLAHLLICAQLPALNAHLLAD